MRHDGTVRRNRWGVFVVSLLALVACDGRDADEAREAPTTAASRASTTTTASLPSDTTSAQPRSMACDPPAAGEDDEASTIVFVYFFCEQAVFAQGTPRAEDLVALPRQVPRTESVLRAALVELLRGTTVDEFNRGFQSFFFGPDTADLLVDVTVTDDGVAIIDFSEEFENFGNVSTAFTASAIYYPLEGTIRQFPTVKDTYYRLEGDRRAWCVHIEPIGCDESFD